MTILARLRRPLAPALLATALLALPGAVAQATVSLRSIGPTFDGPVYVTGAPGDDQRLYVVEQQGTIQTVRDGSASTFVDLRAAVEGPGDSGAGGEQGLLGLAFAPDFQTSRLLYVYFTDTNGDNRVEELRAPTDDAADPASRRLVLSIPHPGAQNHNGGTLRFGPDGLLYLAPGDGGTGGAPAHDLNDLRGKVLRIDPHGSAPGQYTIPAGNPFAGQTGRRGEIWAYGLRNPYRFAFDRATGDLVVGDVGENMTEEIDWLPAASGGGKGADLGWNTCEGSFETGSATTPCSLPGAIAPVVDQPHSAGYRSIIAGPVVRDRSLPSLFGRLVYGDYFVSALRSLQPAAGRASDSAVGPQANVPSLTSLGEDAAGCVYATSATGQVLRLVEQDTRIPCALPVSGPAPPTPPPAAVARPIARPGAKLLRGVHARQRQRVLALGGAVVRVRCATACRVVASGRLRVGTHVYRLRRVGERADAGKSVRLKPRLTRQGTDALRAALDDGRRPRLTLRVRARDGAGHVSSLVRRTVRADG
jgi:hypothetical protein